MDNLKEEEMEIQEFFKKYKNNENLSDISWNDFPAELKEICWEFINRWFQEMSMDDLSEMSGFNNMSLEDLVKNSAGK